MKTEEASKFSIYNMQELNNSTMAGCYYCKSIYKSIDIKETTDNGKTALCPKCGIDSVLPDSSPYDLNIKTLFKLNKYWF